MAENTDIRFRATYDDSDINRALNGIVQSTEAAQDATLEYGQVATQSFNQAAKSADNAAAKLANYKKAIDQNNARIQSLNKSIVAQRVELIQLGNAYAGFGNKASSEAKEVAKQMDLLQKSIAGNTSAVAALTEENRVYGQAVEQAGGKLSLTAFQANNLSFQLSDVASQLSTGTSLFRILIQQGPQITQIFGGTANTFKFFGQQALNAVKSIFSLRGGLALLAGGIVGLIALPIILFLSKSAAVTEFFEQKMAQLSAAVKVIVDRMTAFGSVLVGFIRGQRSLVDVFAASTVAVAGLGTALSDATRDAESYTILLQRMRKEQKNFELDSIATQQQIERLRLTIDDESKSIGQRTKALQDAAKLEAGLESQRVKFAQKRLEDARNNATSADGALKVTDELIKATQDLSDAETAAAQRKAQDAATLRALREESARAAKAEADALKELFDQVDRINKQIEALELENLSPAARLAKESEIAIREIDKLEAEIKKAFEDRKEVYTAADEFEKLRALTRAKYEKQITDVTVDEIGKRLQEEDNALKQKQSDAETFFQIQLSTLEKQKAVDLAKLEAIRSTTGTEAAATRAKEKEKLRIELDYALRRKELFIKEYGKNSLEVQLVQAQIAQIQAAYAELEDTDLSFLDKLKDKILKGLKIDEADAQLLGQAAGGALTSYFEFLDATTELQLQAQDTIIAKLEEGIAKTEEALNKQLDLERQGYANSVDVLKKTLEDQNKERAAAEAKRVAIEREAAKRRNAILAAQQIAETALLAVRIFSEAVKAGGIYGIVLGVAGLAFVIAKIAAVRAQAKAAAADVQGFREGTEFVEGPGTSKSDSINARLSRGERVIPADINEKMGGRRLTNKELLVYYELGRRVALRKEIPTPITAGMTKDRAALDVALMKHAYTEASDKAADKMIEYWKTRPIEKMGPGGKVIEWQEGSAVRRQKIKAKN